MANYDVVIIGGGIVGLCSAYYLSEKGYKIAIIDKGNFEDNCSQGNAGFIVPSHIVPLAAPGMITKGVKWMFNPESPFSISPKINSTFLKWVWEFYKASSQKNVNEAMPFLLKLNKSSKKLYETIGENEEFIFDIKTNGLMMYCNSIKGLIEEKNLALQAGLLNIKTEILSASDLKKLEPGLALNIAGAVYYPEDASINPSLFCKNLTDLLIKKGVRTLGNEELMGFDYHKNNINQITTRNSKLKAEVFLVTAGSWSSTVLKKVGVELLLQGGKGYSFMVNNPPKVPRIPCILSEAKVAVSPMDSSVRFGGTMEINGLNLAINKKRIRGITKAIENYLPQYKMKELVKSKNWVGLRPCSPDGLPYIGKIKPFNNLYVNTGHAMMGVSLAPISGKLCAQLINNEKPSMDLPLLNPNRFH